ncbi:MAG: hypothetical protein J6B88_01590 [Clostridia bacterium]|nr:hypothetical protein [Clostridia bacterium]
MKKRIVVITTTIIIVVLVLILLCIYLINPLIQEHKKQTVISDVEYTTGLDLPKDIELLEGSHSICYPAENKINSVGIVLELTEDDYEFIKNQVIGKKEWGYPEIESEIERRLKKIGWQGEEYDFFRSLKSSEVVPWNMEQLMYAYKKSNGKYAVAISGSADFTEYRNIEF